MKYNRKHIVVIGGTSSIAEHCMRLWLEQAPADIVLVARNIDKASIIAADLRARSPDSTIKILCINFSDPEAISHLVETVTEDRPVDIALIAHGCLPNQSNCERDLNAVKTSLELNAISPSMFSEAFARSMQQSRHGSIVIISSVAGDRGRKSNYVYGAAKGLLNRYAQGLQHRLAGTGVKVVLVKPGPTATPMTAHLTANGPKLTDVKKVAHKIVQGVAGSSEVIYAPSRWRMIMLIIQHLPWAIFKRINL